jgi:hypothetical protein
VAPLSCSSSRLRSGMFNPVRSIPVSAVMLTALLGGMLSTSGCLFQKKQTARVFIPPPPQRPNPAALRPPPIPELPDVRVESTATFNLATLVSMNVELPPPPAPPPKPTPAPPARRPVASSPPPIEAPTPPKIVQLFSPEQEREKNRELDDSLTSVQRSLDMLAKKNLSADQRERVAQIQDFLMQARQSREQDLVTAVNLAKRADTLARDLLSHLP